MSKTIQCAKLGREAPALGFAPYPGDVGQRILHNISQPAWDAWLGHQTMLINEYRLVMTDPKARQFLEQEMIKFLFGEGSEAPQGFVPAKKP